MPPAASTLRVTWNDALADPAGGTLVCHSDVELSNVVFRDGVAVALLDFEFAAPGRPVYDLAQLARLCVPVDDDFDQARLGWRHADRPARLRLVADAYGLGRDGRAELLAAMDDAIDRIEAATRRGVDAGDPNAVAMLKMTGGMGKYDPSAPLVGRPPRRVRRRSPLKRILALHARRGVCLHTCRLRRRARRHPRRLVGSSISVGLVAVLARQIATPVMPRTPNPSR